MTYTVHAGHATQGKAFCGAVGLLDESREDRLIKDSIIKYLKLDGHTVYDCTVDSGVSQSAIINSIKSKINAQSDVTANISIHLNCYNGSATGTECCVYSTTGVEADIAKRICTSISAMGFTNRGLKQRTNLGVLKGITNGGVNILVETFFCDNKSDCELYKSIGSDKFGKIIAEAIVNHGILEKTEEIKMANVFQYTLDGGDKQKWKIERIGDKFMFKNKFNGEYLDVAGGVAKNGVNIQTYAKNSSKAQQFSIEQIKKGYSPACIAPINIVSAIDNKYVVDIAAGSKSNGANADLYSSNNTNAQKFYAIDTGDGYCIFLNVGSLKALTV